MLNRASVRLMACAGLFSVARATALRSSPASSVQRVFSVSATDPTAQRIPRCCYHTPTHSHALSSMPLTLDCISRRAPIALLSDSSRFPLHAHSVWHKLSPSQALQATTRIAAAAAAARATSGVSRITAAHTSRALVASMRGFATTPTNRVRVRDRDDYVRPQDTPMRWGGGQDNSGGNQMDSLTPHVRAHLGRVYSLLTVGCMLAGLGSFLMIGTPLVHVVPFWLPMLGGFVPFLWLAFAPPTNPTLKLSLFLSFALLEGMAIAPLVLMTSMKGALVTSIVLTAAVFGGFSAAAYLSPRASLISWQGPLFGGVIGLVALSLLNAFYPMAIAHSLILYGGLALFSALIAVDTQAMIERARCGVGDHVQDAMQMFLNLINIFVRIAQIMGDR